MTSLLMFSEGEIIGRVSEYETKESFLADVQEGFGAERDCALDRVTEVWIRFYPRKPEWVSGDFPDGCYAESRNGGRGAFRCFMYE